MGRRGVVGWGWVLPRPVLLHLGVRDSREVNDYHAAEEFAFIRHDRSMNKAREQKNPSVGFNRCQSLG